MYKLRRVKTASGKTAVQALLKGGHKHRVIHHFGSASTEEEIEELTQIARDWVQRNDPQQPLFHEPENTTFPLVSLQHLEHLASRPQLLYDLLKQAITTFEFDKHIDPLITDMVCMRLIQPTSKMQTLVLLERQLGITYSPRTMARRLKALGTDEYWGKLEECAIEYAKKHLTFTFSLVFYDVTTLYFESFKSDEDQLDEKGNIIQEGLRKPGFSKDNKFQQPQLVLSLLITPEGFPIKLQVFPGNTFEGHTFLPMITSLQKTYSITQLTVVADAAMLSDEIVQELERLGIGYIVGARLGNLSHTTIQNISTQLSCEHEKTIRLNTSKKGSLICSFSKTRYNKDRMETEKLATKARKILQKGTPVKQSKFLKRKKQQEKSWVFNDALYKKAQLLWGIKGYYTNQRQMSDKEVIACYRNLWKIEYDFRIAKTDLKIRPLYHYRSESIRAHLLICFMALCVSKHLERLSGISIHYLITTLQSITDAVLKNSLTGEIVSIRKSYSLEVERLLKKLRFAH